MVNSVLIVGTTLVLLLGCAEKKTRLWIEPPLGYEVSATQSGTLLLSHENSHSGNRDILTIPLQQAPENLVIEKHKDSSKDSLTVTHADQAFRKKKDSRPTLSYLRGVGIVEELFQKKQFREALIELTPLLEQYPSQANLILMQGTLYRKLGEKIHALDSFKKAARLNKDSPEIEAAIYQLETELGMEP